MKEQDIVNDVLAGAKASIGSYTTAITECSNQQLRSTLQTLRNEAEKMQYQIYQMASEKGYYKAAPPAPQPDIQTTKTDLQSTLQG